VYNGSRTRRTSAQARWASTALPYASAAPASTRSPGWPDAAA